MAVDGERGRRGKRSLKIERDGPIKMKQRGKNMAANFQGETRDRWAEPRSSVAARRARVVHARMCWCASMSASSRQRKDGRPR